ncbi:unnamed protein product [Moneuplotes crassus]|uniref:Uncharacterized protein n=1 Tax=Euplotes crassus TaxID=5936 RepID=A0AAD1X423_EUPCR|nr:unnamed protein product [Moneuplotes crassus]
MIDFDNVMEGYISFGGDKDKPFFREPSHKGNWERVYNHIYHTKDNIIDQQKYMKVCRKRQKRGKDARKRIKSPQNRLSLPGSPSANKLRLSLQDMYFPSRRSNLNRSVQEANDRIDKKLIGSMFLNIMKKIHQERKPNPRSKLSQLKIDAEHFRNSSLKEISMLQKHIHGQINGKGRRKNKRNLKTQLYHNDRSGERINQSLGPIGKTIDESLGVLSSGKKIGSIERIKNNRNRENLKSMNISFHLNSENLSVSSNTDDEPKIHLNKPSLKVSRKVFSKSKNQNNLTSHQNPIYSLSPPKSHPNPYSKSKLFNILHKKSFISPQPVPIRCSRLYKSPKPPLKIPKTTHNPHIFLS